MTLKICASVNMIGGTSSQCKQTLSMDEQVFIPPSTIEETRSALNTLSADMSKNRSLWTGIANVAQGAFQKIDTALTPLKAKVAAVALAGVMQFNILKSKLSDVASAVSSKVGSAFDALKQKMQPVGNAARYVWNTITQPIQGVVSTLGRVGSKFGEILSKAKAALTPIGSIAKSAFGKLGSLAGQGAKAVTKSFLKIAGAPLQKLKTSLSDATTKFRGLFTMFRKQAMYRAFSAIIHSIAAGFKEGMDNAYQYSKALGGNLASSLDSISTSFLYFKNSIGAAVAPLINMLAPAIEYVIDKCVALINVLNQVFAKLSGASTWTKAVKYPTQYAEAADSATAANKELKKSILGIDEINALQDNSSGSGGGASGQDYSQMFEEVQLGEVNNPFADFFKPFADAWANEGQNTIDAIKTAFNGIKDFCTAVGDSFREVWTNGTGQQTLEIILRIFQNILKCVGNLGSGLAKAWKANDNGTKILQNIWNIFNDLLSFVEGIYGATADWFITVIDYESITIDSYHIRRENNVEDIIQFDFTGTLSPITVSGTAKNSFVSARYRTKNVSSTSWSSYATIGGVESGSSSFSFDNDSWITLSSANAYYVQLEVSDKLSTNTITLYINKGQPLVAFRAEKVGINTNNPQSALDVNGDIRTTGTVKMNDRNVQGFIGELEAGTDLNDILTSGIYYVPINGNIQNRPVTNSVAVLEVIEVTSIFVLQRFTCVDGAVYCRGKYNTTWHNWA